MSIQMLKNLQYLSDRKNQTHMKSHHPLSKSHSKEKKQNKNRILMIRHRLFAIQFNRQKLIIKIKPQMMFMKVQLSKECKRSQKIKRLVSINPFGRKKDKQSQMISKKQNQKMIRKDRKMMILLMITKNSHHLLRRLELLKKYKINQNSQRVIKKNKKNPLQLRRQRAVKNLMNH